MSEDLGVLSADKQGCIRVHSLLSKLGLQLDYVFGEDGRLVGRLGLVLNIADPYPQGGMIHSALRELPIFHDAIIVRQGRLSFRPSHLCGVHVNASLLEGLAGVLSLLRSAPAQMDAEVRGLFELWLLPLEHVHALPHRVVDGSGHYHFGTSVACTIALLNIGRVNLLGEGVVIFQSTIVNGDVDLLVRSPLVEHYQLLLGVLRLFAHAAETIEGCAVVPRGSLGPLEVADLLSIAKDPRFFNDNFLAPDDYALVRMVRFMHCWRQLVLAACDDLIIGLAVCAEHSQARLHSRSVSYIQLAGKARQWSPSYAFLADHCSQLWQTLPCLTAKPRNMLGPDH